MFMMKKVTLLFAALMITLGVSAQTRNSSEYFDFPTEVTKMVEITDASQLTEGMQIVIQHNHDETGLNHEGQYLIINSAVASGQSYHTMAMNPFPSGLAMFRLEGNADDGFKLKTIHSETDGVTCYVGQFGGSSLTTTNTEYGNPAVLNFEYTENGFYITSSADRGGIYCLYVQQYDGAPTITTRSVTERPADFVEHAAFKVYEVQETYGTTHYVENATVKLTGQGGNTIVGTHTGWSDFYEFVLSTDAYGCTLSNVHYDEATNTITGNVKFPFSVTGNYVQVPVYLHANANTSKRLAVVDGKLKVVDNEEGDNNLNSQWYIRPRIEGTKISYALENVGTGQYIYHTSNSTAISLSKDAAYYDLASNAAEDAFRFTFTYFANNYHYNYCLYNSAWGGFTSGQTSYNYPGYNFLVNTVSSDAEDIGFVQKYPAGFAFWNAGAVATYPDAIDALLESSQHEFVGNGNKHEVYGAETAIKLSNLSNELTVTFDYNSGGHALLIMGVDIVAKDGTAFVNDYHLGTAGATPKDNVYTLRDVPAGEYTLRYFVCNTPELTGEKGHWLGKNAGTITVEKCSRRLKVSDAPTADGWAANTTWYIINQGESLFNTISAQPAYTDWSNNLMLNNDARPTDVAGLWCIVGNKTDGYRLYNRAWGVNYALQTNDNSGEGDGQNARTSMQEVANATLYDIVLHEYNSTGKAQWFLREHGTENYFLNDRSDYLAAWNSDYAYSAEGSVFTFTEVLSDLSELETNLVPVQDDLEKLWAPWTDCPEISEVYAQNSDFASWVWGRQKLAGLLDGTVFKFTTKATDDRAEKVLGVNEVGTEIIGFDASDEHTTNEYLRLAHKGNGAYTLYHLASAKYFGEPGVAVDNAANAKLYTYQVLGDEIESLAFVTGNQMLHLGDWSHGYKTIDWNDLNDAASRWNVIYNVEAQELAELIDEANAQYEEVMAPAYQANVGVPGYANAESTTNLYNTIYDGLYNTMLAEASALLSAAMNNVDEAEKAVFFPTDCYFTLTNERGSLVYDAGQTAKDEDHNNSDYLWCSGGVDATNPSHLWGFYQDAETGEYYLYNVGKLQFANAKGKGSYGDTWIFSNSPVAITMEALDAPYFHIMGAGKTMSISGGYVGPVITYYAAGDEGIPFQFKKSEVPVDQNVVKQVESLLVQTIEPGFYIFKCDESLYLNDKPMKDDTRRTVTALTANKIDNIFYHTEDSALVGYASGFGFVYGHCNTGNPADGYNTFTFKTAYDPEKIFLKADQGKSIHGWADRYITVNEGILVENSDKRKATAWTIKKVTELPVKFNDGKDGYAYATLYTPVALNIPATVEAYTGVVEGSKLVLTALDGVIPAGTGVVLRTDAGAGTYNFEITTSDLVSDADNVLKGDVFSQVNDGLYYSLANVSGVAFYKYTGKNLTGFRARVSGDEVGTTQPLTFSFRNTTGIEEVTSVFQSDEVYDLSGRRVTSPVKGLYIVNGKKVFIK